MAGSSTAKVNLQRHAITAVIKKGIPNVYRPVYRLIIGGAQGGGFLLLLGFEVVIYSDNIIKIISKGIWNDLHIFMFCKSKII